VAAPDGKVEVPHVVEQAVAALHVEAAEPHGGHSLYVAQCWDAESMPDEKAAESPWVWVLPAFRLVPSASNEEQSPSSE
jgi:hypothetical protein